MLDPMGIAAAVPAAGLVAEWLCSGLQIRQCRFDSGPGLHGPRCGITALASSGLLCQNSAPSQAEYRRPRPKLFRSSSAVEQATVNRRVAGSIPAFGATFATARSFGARRSFVGRGAVT